MNFKRCIDLCFHSGHYLSSSYLYFWARICKRSRALAHTHHLKARREWLLVFVRGINECKCSIIMNEVIETYRERGHNGERMIPFFTWNASRTSSAAYNSNDTQQPKTKILYNMHLMKSYFWMQCILLQCSWRLVFTSHLAGISFFTKQKHFSWVPFSGY